MSTPTPAWATPNPATLTDDQRARIAAAKHAAARLQPALLTRLGLAPDAAASSPPPPPMQAAPHEAYTRLHLAALPSHITTADVTRALLELGPTRAPPTAEYGALRIDYVLMESVKLALEVHRYASQLAPNAQGVRTHPLASLSITRPASAVAATWDAWVARGATQSRVFVAHIDPRLTHDDVAQLFESFGTVRHVRLAEAHGSCFGFVQFAEPDAAQLAAASMADGFDLAGRALYCTLAVTPGETDAIMQPWRPVASG